MRIVSRSRLFGGALTSLYLSHLHIPWGSRGNGGLALALSPGSLGPLCLLLLLFLWLLLCLLLVLLASLLSFGGKLWLAAVSSGCWRAIRPG